MIKDAGAAKVTSKRLMQMIDKRRVDAWKRSEGLEVIEVQFLLIFLFRSFLIN